MAVHHDPTAMTYLKRSTMDRFIVTVDRNDRTVTPKFSINRHVLHDSKHPSLRFKQLTVQTPLSLVSLEFFLFLFQFRTHGGVEVEIWLKIEGEIDA